MNLKTKITLAFLTMLLLLLGVSAFTLYSLNRLDRSARNVLQDNLYSVNLGQQMLRALDQIERQPLTNTAATSQFAKAFLREAGNVTEPGEQELVNQLQQRLTQLQQQQGAWQLKRGDVPAVAPAITGQMRQLTYRIIDVNTQALTRKNEAANRLATEQSGYVLALLTFAVLTCLLFVLSVPEAAVSGLRKLSASIENATHQDYSNSIPVESHDEFGGVARAFNRLLVQLQDYRTSTLAQLLAERNRMVSLVNNLDEGLLLVDENRRLILANPVAQQLLALPPEQLVNRPAEEIAQQNDLFRELLRHLDTPAAQRPTEAAPVLTLAQHDEEAYYRVSVNDVVSFNEALDKMEFVGSILTLRNVSEYKKLDQAKSNFLATVSHELKTPLSSINFSLKLLQNGKVGPVNEEQQNILATIKQENQRLLRLVGELIDVSRLESGNIQLNFQAARVTEVVQFAAATIQLQLQPKQLSLDIQITDTLPPVRADIEKTTWVLLNLLANAIRYSPEQAQIHIRAALTTEAQPQVRISVQDHGPGIAPQYQEKIFQRFVQIPNQSGYKGGSGLGLSIAREFIGSQGGQL
ncbi:signal transduction histidine kinase [Hymenobacter luteus]|uniref:histidine kinase n=2 Tax=Hymenobacter TaxID=89966 RepID=A0A7W9T3E0_9BACT|nr:MULTISPECIES: histidine kinase dimerization/phospho-acceptor domain-containing protein [Hymenobacter]MBB4602965.1 signal transduction histidine kinase [Hymenobacter latericoloratus]MBB6060857.1 signal transduction histidine kinase [Hymenobacter luteus]